MPFRMFHPCPVHPDAAPYHGRPRDFGVPHCPICRAPQAFDCWGPRLLEMQAAHEYAYGLRDSKGPWNLMVRQLLDPRRESCRTCEGRGILTQDLDHWRQCPSCEGTGGHWTCSLEEVEALRKQIVERYPEAGISRPDSRLTFPSQSVWIGDISLLQPTDDEED